MVESPLAELCVRSVTGKECLLAACAVLVVACASGGVKSGTVPAATPRVSPADAAPTTAAASPRARQDQQLITRDVIIGTQYTNMYEVVQAMRSNWLRVKTSSSASGKGDVLQVYLDNQRIGGVDELRRIVPSSVASARYFDPIAASARWGMDHGAGAIYIVTSR